MIGRWLARPGGRPSEPTRGHAFYECTNCRVSYDEWAEDCPRCGQLVVRIVEPAE